MINARLASQFRPVLTHNVSEVAPYCPTGIKNIC